MMADAGRRRTHGTAPRRTLLQRLSPPRPVGEPSRVSRLLAYVLLVGVVLVLVAPFFFVITAAFKDSDSLFQYPPQWIPSTLYLGNFQRLLFDSGFPRWMANTLFVAGTVTVIKLVIDSMAAYAFAKMQFTGKNLLFILLLIVLMVPGGVILIPLFQLAHGMGITNTYLGLILPALSGPIGIFLMRQFIQGLPKDLDNAARLDGVSEFGIYWRIVLPLVKPGLVVLAVIIFTDQYMSFLWPLVTTQTEDLQVLTVGIAGLRAQTHVNYSLWSAAAVMALVPIGIFFFLLQRQFLARSISGALKQ